MFRLPISFPNFYPRPPGGGRPVTMLYALADQIFLSTPSGWRATRCARAHRQKRGISIHALRVEGDPPIFSPSFSILDFYPRPPGGGRLAGSTSPVTHLRFLSTPSGWRATDPREAGRALAPISIHALRVEGDDFLMYIASTAEEISIHALRVEGDLHHIVQVRLFLRISIHALRVEGDRAHARQFRTAR